MQSTDIHSHDYTLHLHFIYIFQYYVVPSNNKLTYQRFAYMDWKKWSIFYINHDFRANVDYIPIHWLKMILDELHLRFLTAPYLDYLILENIAIYFIKFNRKRII